MQLHSITVCCALTPLTQIGGGAASKFPNSLQIRFYLFILSLALATVSAATRVCAENGKCCLLFFPFSCTLLLYPFFFFTIFSLLSFIPMCRQVHVMKSSLSVWPAQLYLSLPLPLSIPPSFLQPLCPSMLI